MMSSTTATAREPGVRDLDLQDVQQLFSGDPGDDLGPDRLAELAGWLNEARKRLERALPESAKRRSRPNKQDLDAFKARHVGDHVEQATAELVTAIARIALESRLYGERRSLVPSVPENRAILVKSAKTSLISAIRALDKARVSTIKLRQYLDDDLLSLVPDGIIHLFTPSPRDDFAVSMTNTDTAMNNVKNYCERYPERNAGSRESQLVTPRGKSRSRRLTEESAIIYQILVSCGRRGYLGTERVAKEDAPEYCHYCQSLPALNHGGMDQYDACLLLVKLYVILGVRAEGDAVYDPSEPKSLDLVERKMQLYRKTLREKRPFALYYFRDGPPYLDWRTIEERAADSRVRAWVGEYKNSERRTSKG